METKLVLLGTGTPNACPNASGPSSAVVVGNRAYLVDFGPGVVRQASKKNKFCFHIYKELLSFFMEFIIMEL